MPSHLLIDYLIPSHLLIDSELNARLLLSFYSTKTSHPSLGC